MRYLSVGCHKTCSFGTSKPMSLENKGSKTTIGKEACHEWITDTLRSVSENVGGAKNDGKYLFATRSPPCWLMKTAVVM